MNVSFIKSLMLHVVNSYSHTPVFFYEFFDVILYTVTWNGSKESKSKLGFVYGDNLTSGVNKPHLIVKPKAEKQMISLTIIKVYKDNILTYPVPWPYDCNKKGGMSIYIPVHWKY